MRRRAGLFGALTLLVTLAMPIAEPAGAATVNLETFCRGVLRGATFTLTANCATSATLLVPNGHTINGAGHAITAHDTTGNNFTQGVVRTAGASMNISNLLIDGIGLGTNC